MQNAKRCRSEQVCECGEVLVASLEVRFNVVGNPAGKAAAGAGDGFKGKPGMIEAPELQSDDQDDRAPKRHGQTGQ